MTKDFDSDFEATPGSSNELPLNFDSDGASFPCGVEFEAEMEKYIGEDDVDVRDYVKKVAYIPLMSTEQEAALTKGVIPESSSSARALRDGSGLGLPGSNEAMEMLVQANLRAPVWIARKYLNRGLSLMALIEAGNAGLRESARKFDYERGYTFTMYAVWSIRTYITRLIASQHRRSGPSDDRAGEHEDEAVITDDFSSDEPATSFTQNLLREEIIAVMAGLSPRERDVLRLRFGLDDGKQRSLDEVGNLFGMTRDRVRQIEAKALRKLHHSNRGHRERPSAKRMPVKRIPHGQFRAALDKLPENEAQILRFKWGFLDGRIRSVDEVAEKFDLTSGEIAELESKALNIVADFKDETSPETGMKPPLSDSSPFANDGFEPGEPGAD